MAAETIATIAEHIVKTPGTCGGRARIKGHRIMVQNVVIEHELNGQSPAEIAAGYPGTTLADIHAALAYYHDHREEIEADIRRDDEMFEQMKSRPSALDEARARAGRMVGPSGLDR